MKQKIVNSEYVDFGKLIPRDKIVTDDDSKFELVVKGGRAYWVPVNESTNISNFTRWEQAFRIYSNIYTRAHPNKCTELLQYNHIIYTISMTYQWDNVYAYDKEFRMHISKHPQRNWGIILQQAWSMHLRDRLPRSEFPSSSHHGNSGRQVTQHKGSNEPCHRFNRGKCNFGANCKYEHRCTYCGKFGHGFFSCRKASADKDKNNKQGDKVVNTTPKKE